VSSAFHHCAQAGQDEQSIMPFRGTIGIDGYVLVYSVASRTSMETVKVLNEKIINESGSTTVPRVLVGNKSDLHNDRSISVEEGKRTAEELNCAFIECSAKHNENICTSESLHPSTRVFTCTQGQVC
jgi:Ras family protein